MAMAFTAVMPLPSVQGSEAGETECRTCCCAESAVSCCSQMAQAPNCRCKVGNEFPAPSEPKGQKNLEQYKLSRTLERSAVHVPVADGSAIAELQDTSWLSSWPSLSWQAILCCWLA